MIEATVLLKDGEKVSFTAADMIQAAVLVERQYYPYEKVDIVMTVTPVQQDTAKGALPLSTIGHPTAQGRALATAAQRKRCIRLVGRCPTSFPPEGFHPSGHPFCDQGVQADHERIAHGSTVNDPNVPVAENPSNVMPDGRQTTRTFQARALNSNVTQDGRIKGAKPPVAENPSNVMPDGRKKEVKPHG